jgi:hypothetical protein
MDGRYYGFRTSADRTVGSENEQRLDVIQSATVDGEDIRSSGLVNGRLTMDYTPGCRCGVQVDR